MRALLLHTKEYRSSVTGLATRPTTIQPEPVSHTADTNADCITALVTVEKEDDATTVVPRLVDEIAHFCNDTGRTHVALIPFAHLSNNLAAHDLALSVLDKLYAELSKMFTTTRAHFGSDKEVLLHIVGHPGNARFREF